MKWINIKKSSNNSIWPNERAGCTLNYYNNCLYLIGGYSDKHLNTFYEYNIKQNKWTFHDCSKVLNGICGHRTIVYSHYLILFGGIMTEDFQHSSKTYTYNFIAFTFYTFPCFIHKIVCICF